MKRAFESLGYGIQDTEYAPIARALLQRQNVQRQQLERLRQDELSRVAGCRAVPPIGVQHTNGCRCRRLPCASQGASRQPRRNAPRGDGQLGFEVCPAKCCPQDLRRGQPQCVHPAIERACQHRAFSRDRHTRFVEPAAAECFKLCMMRSHHADISGQHSAPDAALTAGRAVQQSKLEVHLLCILQTLVVAQSNSDGLRKTGHTGSDAHSEAPRVAGLTVQTTSGTIT